MSKLYKLAPDGHPVKRDTVTFVGPKDVRSEPGTRFDLDYGQNGKNR